MDEKETKEAVEETAKVETAEEKVEAEASDEEVKKEKTEVAPTEETKETPSEEKVTEDTKVVEEKKGEEDEPVEAPEKFKAIVDGVESLSVLDLHELVKLLEKKFGVSATAVAVAGGGAVAGGDDEEAKSSFDAELASVGDQKIAVIKAIKAALGLGLKEAKELVDSAPVSLRKEMKKEDAEALKKEIEEAGGKVELK